MKIQSQVARAADLDALKASCDGLAAKLADAQHQLDSVRNVAKRVPPLVADVNTLKNTIATANTRLNAIKFDEESMQAQEKRLTELLAASATAATEVAEHTRQMQAFSEQLATASTAKEELLIELDRVQTRQRDVASQGQILEDQFNRGEAIFKQLEQRRTQVAFSEKKLAALEARLADLKVTTTELDKSMDGLARREEIIAAVKAELDQVHQIGTKTKADLAHVTAHRDEVASLKNTVDTLLARIHETDDRMAAIDGQRKVVDEVHSKANTIVHLLDDVRIGLETLGEQKAVVDHAVEQVTRLEYTLEEAQRALRTLQHEREIAERIERNISQLRATGKTDDGRRTA
ncbi:MAG: hypothetical protein QM736_22310 [Vicinamibacterales bacterium]